MERRERFPDVMLLSAAGRPDPLLPLAGIPAIERQMGLAQAEGANRFLANVAEDKAAPLLAHFGGLLKVSREPEPSGSGNSVLTALPQLVSDPFFVMDTGMTWPLGHGPVLGQMRSRHRQAGYIVLLCVHPHDASGVGRSHDFCLDPSGNITRDSGAPVLFGGVALLERSALLAMPETAFELDAVFDQALEDERLFGVVLDEPWFSLVTSEGRAAAERALAP